MPSLFLGYASALTACVCFGSFAVPVKSPSLASLDVHPLTFQTYKTAVCLLTSWLSLLPWSGSWPAPVFTAWGVVSGLFWVPGGVCAIYAVQNAGLAVAQGVWSTGIVLVSFAWGLVVFREELRSVPLALLGAGLMVAGLWGMSYFSQPEADAGRLKKGGGADKDAGDADAGDAGTGSLLPVAGDAPRETAEGGPSPRMSRRARGLLAAVVNGAWGGSIMVPMHYAPADAQGLGYVVSFALGASAVTAGLWVLLACAKGRGALPPLHFREMLVPGGTAGLLWSVGNIASMLTVEALGEAVGYSICQSSLLVSGLWGVFWFKEVRSTWGRGCWLGAAAATLGGILVLTAQKGGDDGGAVG
jgi:hypothetical protein